MENWIQSVCDIEKKCGDTEIKSVKSCTSSSSKSSSRSRSKAVKQAAQRRSLETKINKLRQEHELAQHFLECEREVEERKRNIEIDHERKVLLLKQKEEELKLESELAQTRAREEVYPEAAKNDNEYSNQDNDYLQRSHYPKPKDNH